MNLPITYSKQADYVMHLYILFISIPLHCPLYHIPHTGNKSFPLCIYVLCMLVYLYGIMHAIDHLRLIPHFTADIINHRGLLNKAQELFQAMSSRNTYAAGQGRYTKFCKSYRAL